MVHDLSLCFQMVAAVRTSDEKRQRELRHRYLTMLMESMKKPGARGRAPLPGAPPTWTEMNERWAPRQ